MEIENISIPVIYLNGLTMLAFKYIFIHAQSVNAKALSEDKLFCRNSSIRNTGAELETKFGTIAKIRCGFLVSLNNKISEIHRMKTMVEDNQTMTKVQNLKSIKYIKRLQLTKPYPFDKPLSRSYITTASSISPN